MADAKRPMPPPTLDYGSPPEKTRRGYALGRWSLIFVVAAPACHVLWCLTLPWLVVTLGTGVAAIVMTRGRSVGGWIGVGVPAAVLLVGVVRAMTGW